MMAAPNLPPNDREAELIRRVCRGEHDVFYELVRPYERAIYFAAMGCSTTQPMLRKWRKKRS